EGISFDSAGRILATQHGRDQLGQNWPKLYTLKQNANLPAEELVQLQQGRDFGWPECYYDDVQKKLVLAPEYGGDGGKAVGVCAHGFAGAFKEPGRAAHRPTGLAVGTDGALYIADDQGGRIWRVTFRGGNPAAGIAAAAPPPRTAQASTSSNVLPPEGVHPSAGAAPLPTPQGASPDQVALGYRIFHGEADGGTCAGCHGTDGKGTAMGSDLTSGKWLWGNGSLQAIPRTIAEG